LVECNLAKVDVVGSSPITRSRKHLARWSGIALTALFGRQTDTPPEGGFFVSHTLGLP